MECSETIDLTHDNYGTKIIDAEERPSSVEKYCDFLETRRHAIEVQVRLWIEFLKPEGGCIGSDCHRDIASSIIDKLLEKWGQEDFENADNWKAFVLGCIKNRTRFDSIDHVKHCPHSDAHIVSLSAPMRNVRGEEFTLEDVVIREDDNNIQERLEADERLCNFLKSLEADDQKIFEVMEGADHTTAELIAKNTGWSPSKAAKRWTAFRQRIKKEFLSPDKDQAHKEGKEKKEGKRENIGKKPEQYNNDVPPNGGFYE